MKSLPPGYLVPRAARCFFACVALLLTSAAHPAAAAADDPNAVARYRMPPEVVADILTAARTPRGVANLSPDGRRIVLVDPTPMVPLSVLAEPVEKLAGLEVLSSMWCSRPQLKAALVGFSILTLAGGQQVRAAFPKDSRIGAIVWSHDGLRLACVLYHEGGGQLWVVDATNAAARRVADVALQTVIGNPPEWTLDNRAIVCGVVPRDHRKPPAAERIPEGPQVRVSAGKAAPQRTSREVLRTADDQDRFAWATRLQLVRVPVDGGASEPIGRPGTLLSWKISPGDRYVVLERSDAHPLGFPIGLFPRTVEIWSMERTARVAEVGEIPLNDRSSISSVARSGPREWTWAPDGKSLWYCSWEDRPGANFAKAIRDTSLPPPGEDALMRFDAPFAGAARAVARSEYPIRSLAWTADGAKLMAYDGYAPRRQERRWWIDPARPEARKMLVKRSTERAYDHPGNPLARRVGHDWAPWVTPDGASIFLSGAGFRPAGQRPFLDRMDLATGRTTRVFESASSVLETVQQLITSDGKQFVTSRQTQRETPNWFVRTAGQSTGRVLSQYRDPMPALAATRRTQFTFMRDDSVRLNAEVVLPATWKPGQRLPTILWVYPVDYRSEAAAEENRRSPNRFRSQSPLNPEVLVTQGYAVVYPDLAIVGTNDRYVEEVARSAKAVVEECVRRGFCDRDRVGVSGHSYGAFSVANLLAHTDLFRAGTASEGAYNRTLTPFTFQAEERTLWEASDTYVAMSPFMHADRIREPLLLLHDLDDTNVGTHPIQSERMFDALNGLGRTVALVQYPFEDHVPIATESVLDYWARVIEWLDRYVKNAPTAVGASSEGAAPARR